MNNSIVTDSNSVKNGFPPSSEEGKKGRKRPFLILISSVLILSIILFLFLFPQKSAFAQASELFKLYFQIDHVRASSAEIFAELLETKNSPERIGITTQEVGDKPGLKTKDELVAQIEANKQEVLTAIDIIESENYTANDVAENHQIIKDFYNQLFSFEEDVLDGLETVSTNQELGVLITEIFENKENWPAVLEKDEHLRVSLQKLADKYEIEFENISYKESFRKKLVSFDQPKLSDDYGTIEYEFEIPSEFTQKNITASWTGTSIKNLIFGLEHEDGRIINFNIVEFPTQGDVNTIAINNLPQDGTGVYIPSNQYPLVDFALSDGKTSIISYEDSYFVINMFPEDPLLQPISGTWTLHIAAPAGLEIITGNTTL